MILMHAPEGLKLLGCGPRQGQRRAGRPLADGIAGEAVQNGLQPVHAAAPHVAAPTHDHAAAVIAQRHAIAESVDRCCSCLYIGL